jgi:hypothetical protein
MLVAIAQFRCQSRRRVIFVPMTLLFFIVYASVAGIALAPSRVLAWSCDSQCDQSESECINWIKLNCPTRLHDSFLFPDPSYKPRRQLSIPKTPKSIPKSSGSSPNLGSQGRLLIRASRAFAGPREYPPTQFAAYGIVAFQSLPFDTDETNRYINICRGYLAAVPRAKNLLDQGIPLSKQMVTVWTLDNARLSGELNSTNQDPSLMCRKAVSAIDIVSSRNAILNARLTKPGKSFDGRGPYVIAWSPAQSFGKTNAAVLVLNLSNVSTSAQAAEIFRAWSNDIEANPQLWTGGWNNTSIRVILRLWADRWGSKVLSLLSMQK